MRKIHESCEKLIGDQDLKIHDSMTKFTSGWRMVKKGTWCAQYSVIPEKRRDIMRKAPPKLEETDGYSATGSLPMQPQVTMGSGLVDPSCDSG